MRPLAIAGLLALAAAATGCGTGADRSQAGAAVQRLYAAVRAHDGQTACAQLSPSLRAELVKDAPSCDEAVTKLRLRGSGGTPTVRVFATSAQVVLPGGDTAFLTDTDEGWRVEALGCEPVDGGPYDCEAEA